MSESKTKQGHAYVAAGVVCLLLSALFFAEALVNSEARFGALLFALAFLGGGLRGIMRDRGAGFFMAILSLVLILQAAVPLVMVFGFWKLGRDVSAFSEVYEIEDLLYPGAAFVVLLCVAVGYFRARNEKHQHQVGSTTHES